MRLSLVLNLFKKPKGNLFTGKNRLVKQVTKTAVEQLRKEFQIEEENMFYLRHTYLTTEQSHGHVRALGKDKKDRINKFVEASNRKFEKNKTLENELGHLRVAEDWDFKAGCNF